MNKSKVLGVIPARLKSTRLPRKMLLEIFGKPLIYWTWKQAKKAKFLDAVIIATDSKEIFDTVRGFGAEVMMTSPKCKTGSDRVAEASRKYKKFKPDIVINIQGDEPMMPPKAINQVAKILVDFKDLVMSSVCVPITNKEDLNNHGIPKVVLDRNNYALYFSRFSIPYPREQVKRYFKHIGLYGFKYNFLQKFVKFKKTPLEKAESLEQLRVLENGYKIKMGIGKYNRMEVNEKNELDAVIKIFKDKNDFKKSNRNK